MKNMLNSSGFLLVIAIYSYDQLVGIQNQLKAVSSVNFPTPRGKAKGEGERDCALQETFGRSSFPTI